MNKKLEKLKIVLDVDGTVFYHRIPKLGKPIPGWEKIKTWVDDGAIINISTMRSGKLLEEALKAFDDLGIPYHSVYKDRGQESWTQSPKCYGHVIVDDTCCGIPTGVDEEGKDFVLLNEVDKIIRKKYENNKIPL